MSSTAMELMDLEANKKSGGVAALLNLLLPGVGYLYCERYVSTAVLFGIVYYLITTFGLATAIFYWAIFPWWISVIDGFLAANAYNKKLTKKHLKRLREQELR